MKKSITAIVFATVMILAMMIPLVTVKAAVDPTDWYKTVPGVLATDYYTLYPYETDKSLNVGFSKFGELIDSSTNTGLEYSAVDPFAPAAGSSITAQVPKRMWIQGWFINISYIHRTLGPRNVWAFAMFSDTIDYGNDWIRVDFTNDRSTSMGLEDGRDPGQLIYGDGSYGTNDAANTAYGGRKTNGTAVTDPINVLYDGPREFIAECRTTLYDHPLFHDNNTQSDIGLVQICITIVFDKVKKEVNLLKDVKSILVLKEGERMKIQFSNRGEVDLGTDAATYASYAHFYTTGTSSGNAQFNDTEVTNIPTVYNRDWELIQTENPNATDYPGYSAAGPYPQIAPAQATIDVAQAINPTAGYVWYAAFWPSTSDWSIDGWDNWWHSLSAKDPHYIDLRATIEEPSVPFYIGEWDFVLYYEGDVESRTQFRGVTEYGVIKQHDASDAQITRGTNRLDREVNYYLNQTFNPWDLNDAVEKKTTRWVEYWNQYYMYNATSYTTAQRYAPVKVVSNADWYNYASFSERLEDVTSAPYKLVPRSSYTITANADGTATVSGLSATKLYKFLYSTDANVVMHDISAFTFFASENSTEEVNPEIGIADDASTSWTDVLGSAQQIEIDDMDLEVVLGNDTADFTAVFTPDLGYGLQGYDENFAVSTERGFTGSWDFMNTMSEDLPLIAMDNGNASIEIDDLDVHWTIDAREGKTVNIDTLNFQVDITVTVSYNATEDEMNVTAVFDLNPASTIEAINMYEASAAGRYEWVEVGRDSAAVDSVGSAMVAEAMDSWKEVAVGIAGEDMWDPVVANQIPSVMAKFGSGNAVADYKDAAKAGNQPGYRAALIDDWCTFWPVTTSNMISVGGPIANVLSYYANDFTTAFYGITQFSGNEYADKITGIPCWDRNWTGTTGYNLYQSSATVGYAVISTTLDINGTELFTVYGHWGRDTYYASMWLHGEQNRGVMAFGGYTFSVAGSMEPGLVELQRAPAGVQSIILQITYSQFDPKHPTYSIPEVLGTISERTWTDYGATDVTNPVKGGIHDP